MADELPPVPKRRSDPEMQNFIYKGGKPGPRRRPNPRLENPIYEKVSVNDENAILRAQNDELAREAIGMKAAWEEVRKDNERLKADLRFRDMELQRLRLLLERVRDDV